MDNLPIAPNGTNRVDFLLPPVKTRKIPGGFSGSDALPLYVKHGYPEVFKKKKDYYDYLPKMAETADPEAEETYGLMYHKPETEAEIKMHDLWIAKRKQETFEWKSQQQLNLVLDRLSLHKSRLESDLLRRHESGAYVRGEGTRPKSANAKSEGLMNRNKNRLLSGKSSTRGASASAKFASPSKRKKNESEKNDDSNPFPDDIYEDTGDDIEKLENPAESGLETAVVVKIMKNGIETEQTLTQSIRKTVRRVSVSGPIPMRYKTPIPLSYAQEHYLQLSDSDDEGNLDNEGNISLTRQKQRSNKVPPGAGAANTTNKVKKGNGAAVPIKILFKREANINRERPVSGAMFRSIAEIDPELKVLYRYTNYRRMPMTTQQETWLEDQEKERTKFSIEYAKKLVADQLAKALKKKEIDKPKKDDQSKGKGKEMMKNTAKLAKEALLISKNPIKPKYKSASDFMEKNFPNFDREDDLNDENEDGDDSSNCPMRATQLHESDRVMAAFAKFNLSVKESVVRNALLVPQDKPEAICLEQMRNSSLEGLMSNPLKRELWRDSVKKSMKKGGKKKRAKK